MRLAALVRWRTARAYALLVAVGLVTTAAGLAYALRVFAHPGEWLYYEGANLFHAGRFGDAETLYRPIDSVEGLHFPIYPPGYYLAWAPWTWVTDAMWPGRLISLVSMGFTSVATFQIGRRLGGGVPAAAAGALSLMTFPWMVLLASSARPDSLALALAAGCLWAVTRWEDDGSSFALTSSALLGVAMVFTKHNYGPLVLAVVLAVALRDPRAARRFVAVTLMAAAITLTVVEAIAGSFLATVVGFGGGTAWAPLRATLLEVFADPYPHPALALAVVPIVTARRPRAAHLAWFAGFVTLLTAAKVGSSMNYGAVMFLASAALLAPALEWADSRGAVVGVAVSTVVAVALMPALGDELAARRADLAVMDEARRSDEQAIARLADRGLVLGDRDDLLLRAGHEPRFEPYVYAQLEADGAWDPNRLHEAILAGRFDLVQTSFDLDAPMVVTTGGAPRWPLTTVAAIRSTYCQAWALPGSRPTVGAASGVWLYERC